MLAMVAVASAAGSVSLRSLPRACMRVRPARMCASQRLRPVAIAAPRVRVLFCELACEGANRAAAARLLLDLMLDHEVEPAVDAGPRVEVV